MFRPCVPAVYDEKTDEWVLNGTKTWITNGGITHVPTVHVVVAAVDSELKARGHASFVIAPGTPGLSMGRKFKKHGIRESYGRGGAQRLPHSRKLPARWKREA